MKKKEYIVFWTYSANYADVPKRVFARNPWKAIINSFRMYAAAPASPVRFLVFEVGGDLVHNGTGDEAYNKFESEYTGLIAGETCKCGQWSIEEYGENCPSCVQMSQGPGGISPL